MIVKIHGRRKHMETKGKFGECKILVLTLGHEDLGFTQGRCSGRTQ